MLCFLNYETHAQMLVVKKTFFAGEQLHWLVISETLPHDFAASNVIVVTVLNLDLFLFSAILKHFFYNCHS